jgi:hypothetical protein
MHGLVTADRKYEEEKERIIEAARRASEEGQGDPEEEGAIPRRSEDSAEKRGVGVDDVLDSDSIHDYASEVRRLNDVIAGLERERKTAGTTERRAVEIDATIQIHQSNIDIFKKQLIGNSETGSRRRFSSPDKKSGVNVGNCIREVLKLLNKHLPGLYDHFARSMELGTTIRYKSTSIDWDLAE